MTIDEYNILSFWSLTSLFRTIAITIAVVMLSSRAEREKVVRLSFQSSPTLLPDASRSRTKSKPPLLSTTSTMTIAPIRKNSISPVSPRAWVSEARCSGVAPFPMHITIQQRTAIRRATADLLMRVRFSMAIRKYPATKMMITALVMICVVKFVYRHISKTGPYFNICSACFAVSTFSMISVRIMK